MPPAMYCDESDGFI